MGTKIVTFKIDENLLELLDYIARKQNTSRSELIRRAIVKYITNHIENKR